MACTKYQRNVCPVLIFHSGHESSEQTHKISLSNYGYAKSVKCRQPTRLLLLIDKTLLYKKTVITATETRVSPSTVHNKKQPPRIPAVSFILRCAGLPGYRPDWSSHQSRPELANRPAQAKLPQRHQPTGLGAVPNWAPRHQFS